MLLSSRDLLAALRPPPPTPLPPMPSAIPAYCCVPGTSFLVDAFSFAGPWATAYFLSHFSDAACGGLSADWDAGVIFCSSITARSLLASHFRPRLESLVVPIDLDVAARIDGATVFLVDANLSPGAVQLLFQVGEARVLHTGAMQYSASMKESALLCSFVGSDVLLLDTQHSNDGELNEYILFLLPREIIPIGLEQQANCDGLVQLAAEKRRTLQGFKRSTPDMAALGRSKLKRVKAGDDDEGKCSFREQLREMLPSWVTSTQMDRIHLQTGGDLTAAVPFFLEHQAELELELEEEPDDTTDGAGGSQSITDVSCSLTPPGSQSTNDNSRRANDVPKPTKATGKTRPKLGSTRRSKKKGIVPAKDQRSILTFFKKQSSFEATAGDPPSQQETQETPAKAEAVVDKEDAVRQLLDILGNDVSEASASAVLEKSGWDVATALDAYWRSEAHQDVTAAAFPREGEPSSTQTLKPGDSAAVDLPVSRYDPKNHACWEAGDPAPYLHLARTFELVEKEKGRLKTTAILCNMFRSLLELSPDDVLPALYLTTNRLAPDYENVDLNIGSSTIVSAIEEATGTSRAKLKEMYNTLGDLGDVAQICRQNQALLRRPRPLSIRCLFSALKQISKETGHGSGSRKKSLVLSLFQSCREKEVTYVVRTLVQNMRIGAMERTVLPALAQAVVMQQTSSTSEALRSILQEVSLAVVKAYNFLPNFDHLVPQLIAEGAKFLSSPIRLSPGIPIKPMLARITNGVAEILKHFEGMPFTCEFKYDGWRAQIHLRNDGSICLFSRNCENSTLRFPDVIETIRRATAPGVLSFIVDAEVVAVDRKHGNKILPFQSLGTRERGERKEISAENVKVDVCVFVFDIMYLNEHSLVDATLRRRRQKLRDVFTEAIPGFIDFAAEMTVEDGRDDVVVSSVENFLHASFEASCEGLMVKALEGGSEYAPSKRGDAWLKLKKDYMDGTSDSVDLVPIGAWHGNGRKAGWYSPFLLACYDPDTEEFQSVCRVMSGFTDAFYEQMNAFYTSEKLLPRKPSYYRTLEQPDVWLSAEKVWEIRGADFTISPVHQAAAGLVHPSRGISMRFPRFLRERSDKHPCDATSSWQMAQLFARQKTN